MDIKGLCIYPLLSSSLLIFFSSLVVTVFALRRLSRIALKFDLLDYPNERKVHNYPKPLVGGLGMIIGVSFCLLFIILPNLRGFYVGAVILGIVGFLDDFKNLDYRWKFAAQILAALSMIYLSDTVLISFGDLLSLGSINLGVLVAIPVTLFCTVGVINAINMIDGLDGLAGGISLIAFISFAILASINEQTDLMLLSLVLSGAIVGFLRYNWYPSKLFMGDSGSLFLGFSLAFLSIAISQKDNSHVCAAAPLLILAVPIVDTAIITIKRMLNGRNPFVADKCHLHHILLDFGLNKKRTVKMILLVSAILSFFSVASMFFGIPDYYLFLIFLIYFILYLVSSFYVEEMLRFKLRFRRKRGWENERIGKLALIFIRAMDHVLRVNRKYKRYNLSLPFSFVAGEKDQDISGISTIDIGGGGFSARLKQLLSVGDKIDIAFFGSEEDSGARLFATAQIVWSSEEDGRHRYGFKFINMDKLRNNILNNYLNYQYSCESG
jgi:UDP-GlcNAc:undecaprenyl-phosphate GlcNAc-1-phosphate transferase